MTWYHYIVCFLAGPFVANVVPHFVHDTSSPTVSSDNGALVGFFAGIVALTISLGVLFAKKQALGATVGPKIVNEKKQFV
jgi:hypothetical protein